MSIYWPSAPHRGGSLTKQITERNYRRSSLLRRFDSGVLSLVSVVKHRYFDRGAGGSPGGGPARAGPLQDVLNFTPAAGPGAPGAGHAERGAGGAGAGRTVACAVRRAPRHAPAPPVPAPPPPAGTPGASAGARRAPFNAPVRASTPGSPRPWRRRRRAARCTLNAPAMGA